MSTQKSFVHERDRVRETSLRLYVSYLEGNEENYDKIIDCSISHMEK